MSATVIKDPLEIHELLKCALPDLPVVEDEEAEDV